MLKRNLYRVLSILREARYPHAALKDGPGDAMRPLASSNSRFLVALSRVYTQTFPNGALHSSMRLFYD